MQNGNELREEQVASWRKLIRQMAEEGERLAAVVERIDQAKLTETEQALLRTIASQGHSMTVERFKETAGDFGD
jgi:transposase